MNYKTRAVAAGAAAMILVACAKPEVECREGVTEMKSRLVGVVGSSEHTDARDPVVRAHTHLDIAQTQLATGSYDGCLESLKEARGLLNQSQRTNQ